jgi:hypothetical protein
MKRSSWNTVYIVSDGAVLQLEDITNICNF